MNLDKIKGTVQTESREVEFKPVGKPTGWFFDLRHESSPEVQGVMRRFQSKVRELALKRKTTAYQNLVNEHEDHVRVAHVAGWRWENGPDPENGRPDFSKKELRSVLHDDQLGYHIKSFIDEEVGSLDDFLTRSEDS